jgi:hypothetical protein
MLTHMADAQGTETARVTPDHIPRSLAPWFQEYRFDLLDPEADWELIIERTLAYGNRAEVRWLRDRYGSEAIATWLRADGERRLPRRRFVLWSVLLLGVDPPGPRPGSSIWPH